MSQLNPQELIDQFTQARDQANQANRQRYQKLIDTLGSLQSRTGDYYEQAQEDISQLGEAEQQQIESQAQRQLAQTQQGLISSGLGNTTVQAATKRGIMSDAQRQRRALVERLAQQRSQVLQNMAGADIQTTQMKAQAIQSRQDQGPNTGQYMSAIQGLAQQQAQQGAQQGSTFVPRGVPDDPIFPDDPAAAASGGQTGTYQVRGSPGRTQTSPKGSAARTARRKPRNTSYVVS